MELLLLYLFIALFFSFLCSILEAVILSITPSFIEIKLHQGKNYAKRLKKLKENINQPLAAVLTLNTFAHTLGAAGVGAQAQILWGNEYLSIVSIALTIIILLLSEIIPKTLGASYWKQLAQVSSVILKILIFLLYPFVLISETITRLLKKDTLEAEINREEFEAMTDLSINYGVIKKDESTIIRNLLRLNKIMVNYIMTPRTVVVSANEELTVMEFYQNNKEVKFSRIPVYKENIDDITGFVLKTEILENIINKNYDIKLKEIKREIQAVYDKLHIPELFNYLMKKNEHIALVVDEYGGMQGVVTIEDVVETLLGMEIMDEKDSIEDMQLLARQNWEKRAQKLGLIKKSEK